MSSVNNNNNNYRYPTQQYQTGLSSPAPASMSSQRFCLRWNNHQSNLLSVFDQLLHDESFVDVTLAVEGQFLRAHKMVLSACSPYFQALFVNHPDKHPIVILKDVPYADMRSLLDFMYRGEVSVDQDRLTAFLRVAESLRIKGLTEVNEDKCDIPAITSSLMQPQQNSHNAPPQLHRIQPSHKRIGHILNPLLGNALMQPKRKRGRPRKLSGSSNGTPGMDDFDSRVSGDMLVQGSPEMLEVKMGMDGFAGNVSDSSSGKADGRDMDESDVKMKREQDEPVAGTSKEQDKTQDDYQSEYHSYHENNQNHSNLPSITVELISAPIKVQHESVIISTEHARHILSESTQQSEPALENIETQSNMESSTGVHFLTDEDNGMLSPEECDYDEALAKKKSELLEYLIRDDGSVVCKLCGEVLASRTHWYRHKYKFHVVNTINPSPLFKCRRCNVFFKSRKGYMGHISTRHSENVEQHEELNISIKEEVVETEPKLRKRDAKNLDWEQQREKEEKLVADIIDRVRKECEAQGAAVTRRGYSRRSTVMMNSCN